MAIAQIALFAFQLEEGEIDVRYNSFKGCILQQNSYKWLQFIIIQISSSRPRQVKLKGYLYVKTHHILINIIYGLFQKTAIKYKPI